jgi:hypothetical protein
MLANEKQRLVSEGGDAMFNDGQKARQFFLAGHAIVTLVSEKTGTRFTYRVNRKENTPWFVAVLSGPNNTEDYAYLGTIFGDGEFRHGRKSRIGTDAPSARAFNWAWQYLTKGELPPQCEVHHEGMCGRCGRTLTVPESIELGFGPECANKVGM